MVFLSALLFLVSGHLAGTYLFYFFHRHIFHGSLGRYPVLSQLRAIHTRHHSRPDDPDTYLFPWWANLIIWSSLSSLFLIAPMFSIGIASFFMYYAYRHRSAHTGKDTKAARHHKSHHYKNPAANFSGAHPFVDRVFGTYDPSYCQIKR